MNDKDKSHSKQPVAQRGPSSDACAAARKRRSFSAGELPNSIVAAVGTSRMDERHAYLDHLVEDRLLPEDDLT